MKIAAGGRGGVGLPVDSQRFCPLCDRPFAEGEAVLRCQGCGVMHHPGCWVRRGGCSTEPHHDQAPLVQAYSGSRLAADAARSPAEGTRVAPAAQPVIDDVRPTPVAGGGTWPGVPLIVDESVASTGESSPAEPVIGSPPPGPPVRRRPPAPYVARSSPGLRERPGPRVEPPRREPRLRPLPERPVPDTPSPAGERRPPAGMPRVYAGNRLAQYWYVPVAAALAALVAGAVILAADALFGEESAGPARISAPASDDTPARGGASPAPAMTTPTGTAVATTVTPTAVTTPGLSPAPTTPAAGAFQPGDTLVVRGTGDCLNVRQAAGTANPVVTCVAEGSRVTVVGGPEQSGGLTWWQITTPGGTGWAAGDYLVRP